MKILFIADFYFYKNVTGKTSFNFINYISNNCNNHIIKIIYTDENIELANKNIVNFNPDLIIFFEINAFQSNTKKFDFVFKLNKKIFVFLDDSYYITSITGNCPFINQCNGLLFWYNNTEIINSYLEKFPNKIVKNFNSRFINTEIYKDYKLEKKYDILIYGTRNFFYNYKQEELIPIQKYYIKNNIIEEKINFYPLRNKLENLLNLNKNKYNIISINEACCYDAIISNEELSKLINQSYLTVSCSSIADVLFHKHLEITASKSVILGQTPSDYKNLFEGNIIEVNEFMTDEEILNIIDSALNDKEKLVTMSNILYEKVQNEHHLNKAVENFKNIIDQIQF